uniref:Phorbol-ester/DAG-type domain-containing protein n=1 Tax=Daphnia galeata TaxID=27404 RepID=A0A8J2RQH2_9CRUS|nr:unnamed protein product [Daphnia galeata]
MSSYTGLESETDDDPELHLNHHHHLSHDHVSSRYILLTVSSPGKPGFENDDDANSSKRRKRDSIFFRKCKDKDKEKSKLKQPHQFVPVCHSNSQPCDVCSKSLTNKAALRCESCAITFHENSCRDQVRDCTRFKVPKSRSHFTSKRLVREKAGGQDTRSSYLISSNPDEPEMYELKIQNSREKRIWIDTIRAAMEQCPEDEEGNGKGSTIGQFVWKRKWPHSANSSWLLLGSDSAPPKYSHLVEQGFQSAQAKETLSQAMTELCRLLGLLLSSNAAAN